MEFIPGLQVYVSHRFDGTNGVLFAFVGRLAGSFNPYYEQSTLLKAQRIINSLSEGGCYLESPITSALVHGQNVAVADEIRPEMMTSDADVIFTQNKNQPVLIYVADCAPVLFYDAEHQTIALAHIGRTGALNNLVGRTIEWMQINYSCDPSRLTVSIGPHIGCCPEQCYTLPTNHPDLGQAYTKYPAAISFRDDLAHISLQQILVAQLKNAGVTGDCIEKTDMCTYCNPTLFSYRRRNKHEKEIKPNNGAIAVLL